MFLIMDFQKLKVERKEYNNKIIELISNFLDTHNDIRFNQLMYILNNTVDYFNEEPKITYKRFLNTLQNECNK